MARTGIGILVYFRHPRLMASPIVGGCGGGSGPGGVAVELPVKILKHSLKARQVGLELRHGRALARRDGAQQVLESSLQLEVIETHVPDRLVIVRIRPDRVEIDQPGNLFRMTAADRAQLLAGNRVAG